jgi:capsular polysaccharide transport system permease protein
MNFLLALSPGRLKLILIALPLALAAVYLAAFAADRYVSETVVTVRQASNDSGAVPGVALLLGAVNPPSREDTLYLREYVHSLDMLQRLDAKLQVRKHYEADNRDVLFRLRGAASQEDFLDYYRSRVDVLFDDTASLLTVRVQAFDAAFAQRVAQTILQECERFVNEFSQRMAREQMAFAQTELDRASERVEQDKARVLAFQAKHKLLDPTLQAQAVSALTAELQASLSKQEAELRASRSFLNDNSYAIRAQRSQIEATRAQIDIERLRGTAGASGERLNALAADFQELLLRATFAQDAYRLALVAVENARVDATRKIKSLVVIEPPAQPQTARYPRRWYDLATLLAVSSLLYAIARVVIATIREHSD